MCPPAEFVDPINTPKNAIARAGSLPSVTRRERHVTVQGQPQETIFTPKRRWLAVGRRFRESRPTLRWRRC
jgi:hypothetical protein